MLNIFPNRIFIEVLYKPLQSSAPVYITYIPHTHITYHILGFRAGLIYLQVFISHNPKYDLQPCSLLALNIIMQFHSLNKSSDYCLSPDNSTKVDSVIHI